MTAPGRDENYSTHKDRSDQKYHIEQTFSDGGNSRRFDNQERESVNGGFMTSTPYTNSQAVFTPVSYTHLTLPTKLEV